MINKPGDQSKEIVQSLPKSEPLLINIDFPADQTGYADIWHHIVNSTEAWIEKEIGRTIETHGEQMFYLMGQVLGELWKNVNDHGGKKGYYYLEKEHDPILGQDIFHFVVGDEGKGIKATAGSLEKFFEEGFSTGNKAQGNQGLGGYSIKEYAKKLNIHLVLYDAGERSIVNDELREYDRHMKANSANLSIGTHFIASMILPKKEKSKPEENRNPKEIIFERDFDFSDHVNNDEEFGKLQMEFFPILVDYLKEKADDKIVHLLPKILNEGTKNIVDYGGGKGYIIFEEVTLPNDAGKSIHFAFGDYGPGIKKIAGSYENFYKKGFTTAGHGNGGHIIKERSQECDIHLTLIDNGESEIVNEGTYKHDRMPQGRDMSKGAHFIGIFKLLKK